MVPSSTGKVRHSCDHLCTSSPFLLAVCEIKHATNDRGAFSPHYFRGAFSPHYFMQIAKGLAELIDVYPTLAEVSKPRLLT
jgi:hypothetical protein